MSPGSEADADASAQVCRSLLWSPGPTRDARRHAKRCSWLSVRVARNLTSEDGTTQGMAGESDLYTHQNLASKYAVVMYI